MVAAASRTRLSALHLLREPAEKTLQWVGHDSSFDGCRVHERGGPEGLVALLRLRHRVIPVSRAGYTDAILDAVNRNLPFGRQAKLEEIAAPFASGRLRSDARAAANHEGGSLV